MGKQQRCGKAERLKPRKKSIKNRPKSDGVRGRAPPPAEVFLRMVPHCTFFTHVEIADLAGVCKDWAGMVGRLHHEAAVGDFLDNWPQLAQDEQVLQALDTKYVLRLFDVMEPWRKVQPGGIGFWAFPLEWYAHPLLQLEKVSQQDKLVVYRDWAEFNMRYKRHKHVDRTIRPEAFGRIMYDLLQAHLDAEGVYEPSVFSDSPFYDKAELMSTSAKYMTMNWVSRKLYGFIKSELCAATDAQDNTDVTFFHGIADHVNALQSPIKRHAYMYHWLYIMSVQVGTVLPWDFCFEGDKAFALEHFKLVNITATYFGYYCSRGDLLLEDGATPATMRLRDATVQCFKRLRGLLMSKDALDEGSGLFADVC